ncbi:hypothetical protein [Neisseria gonorrhoeae]|nr:hypothetical protein [Neisseria gonorrhoeae]
MFWLKDGRLARKDSLFEVDYIYGADGCGFAVKFNGVQKILPEKAPKV